MSAVDERFAVGESYSFLNRQLGLLGERDPLEVLAATPARLRELVTRHDAEALRRQPFPGKWTPLEILGHLLDTEWILGFRARTIFGDLEPNFLGCDQDRWVMEQGHNERSPEELLGLFESMRRVTLDFWRRRAGADQERVGHHGDAGVPFTLGLLRRVQAGHDLAHLEQLERYLAAL